VIEITLKFVAQHPSLICSRLPVDAHHLRFAQSRSLCRKVSDEFTVPLCRGHHREAHRCGDEAAWWRNAGIDPIIAALSLWLESRPRCPGQRETLNGLRDAEADRLRNAQRYERSEAHRDTGARHYERKPQTKAGEVQLKIPKLRQQTRDTDYRALSTA
jgi:hypothetical protein